MGAEPAAARSELPPAARPGPPAGKGRGVKGAEAKPEVEKTLASARRLAVPRDAERASTRGNSGTVPMRWAGVCQVSYDMDTDFVTLP